MLGVIEKEHALYKNLKNYFGYTQFRAGQKEIILSILDGKDQLVIMPTGGGKSICYQLPATLLPGLTLVISPLIALMKDQVDGLHAIGIGAAYINSSQQAEEHNNIFSEVVAGQIKLLYVAPESLNLLKGIVDTIEISMVAIDEAHCISAWGHDFRPAYTKLGFLKKRLPQTPIVALTATADKATREDIRKQLNLTDAREYISSFDRANLSLNVQPGTDRVKKILDFLSQRIQESGIIYCTSRKGTEQIAEKLITAGYNAQAYHAGMSFQDREAVQQAFINDDIQIVCATIAFGMGIDKSNVRWVIHYNLPKNIEGYYQEIGRAGRDGLPSDTLLFHSYADMIQLRNFAEDSPNAEVQLAKLERMKQYADATSCRRRVLLSYFGENITEDCGNCDICKHPPAFFEATTLAQKVLSAVARTKGKANLSTIVDILRGSRNANILDKNYDQLPTYGIGKEVSWKDWQQYVIQLVNQGYLEIAFHEHSNLRLTPLAKAVLFDQQKVLLSKNEEAKKEQKKTTTTKPKTSSLFENLRQLRLQISKEEGVPAYQIFSDASLKEMERDRPMTDEEFMQISGVGKLKMQNYGYAFIKAIIAFHKEKRTNKKGIPTYKITSDLYKQGKDLDEIVAIRGLKRTTIISHICKAYEADNSIALANLISTTDLEKLASAYTHFEKSETLKPYFEYFNEQLSYETIRIGLTLLKANNT